MCFQLGWNRIRVVYSTHDSVSRTVIVLSHLQKHTVLSLPVFYSHWYYIIMIKIVFLLIANGHCISPIPVPNISHGDNTILCQLPDFFRHSVPWQHDYICTFRSGPLQPIFCKLGEFHQTACVAVRARVRHSRTTTKPNHGCKSALRITAKMHL